MCLKTRKFLAPVTVLTAVEVKSGRYNSEVGIIDPLAYLVHKSRPTGICSRISASTYVVGTSLVRELCIGCSESVTNAIAAQGSIRLLYEKG